MAKDSGKLIVIEGGDEVGKSTLGKKVVEALRSRTQVERIEYLSFPGRKEGTLGELVYRVHHNPVEFDIGDLHPAALQTMHIASHIDAIERMIKPLLNVGVTIVLDRFWWSTVVYGQIGGLHDSFLNSVVKLEEIIWSGIQPDIAFLIECEKPLAQVTDEIKWQQVKEGYRRLLSNVSPQYPLYRIANDGNIADAVSKMIDNISGVENQR